MSRRRQAARACTGASDVERAVRIRDLVLREGLTLAGVRRRLDQEAVTTSAEDELIAEISTRGQQPAAAPAPTVDRERVAQLKQGLKELLATLSRPASSGPASTAGVDSAAGRGAAATQPARPGKRELTVEPDGEPSLFAEEVSPGGEPAAEAPATKRKRGGRAAAPPAD